MKRNKIIYFLLMFLPILITLSTLPFLPSQVPAHYDATGAVTRYGSKYESLIFPLLIIPFGYFMLYMGKLASKDETNQNNNNEKVVVVTGIMTLILFNVMTGFFLYTDFAQVENLNTISLDLSKVFFSILGIFMIVIGNIMPKCKKNSMIGLRTKWSMSSEVNWKKSQKYGGISFIVSGILLLVGNLFVFSGSACFIYSILIMLMNIIIDVIYTYSIAKIKN